MDYTTAGNAPCVNNQTVKAACNLALSMGALNDYYKAWRNKNEVSKTWDVFKSFFQKDNQDLRLTNTTSTASSDGHQASNVYLT